MLTSSVTIWKEANGTQVDELEAANSDTRLMYITSGSFKEKLGVDMLVFRCPNQEQLGRWLSVMKKEEQRGAAQRNLILSTMVFPVRKDEFRKKLADHPGIIDNLCDKILRHAGVTLDPKDYEPCDALVEWQAKNPKTSSKGAYFEPLDAWFVVRPPSGPQHDRYLANVDGKAGYISATYDYVIDCLEYPKLEEFKVIFQKYPGIVIPLADLIREASGAYEDLEVGK